ncbi:MAG: Crp/Fnr family transcriptional regulator [Acidobacteriota bacterium]|nr:Crp/Fnr family transcriptional regulator [Acidobacteriota bacterium]
MQDPKLGYLTLPSQYRTAAPSSAPLESGRGGPSSTLPRRSRNAILAQLPQEEYAALARHLVPVAMPLGFAVSEPNQPIEFIYFLESGLISTDALSRAGEQIEVGVIGREGFSGLPALLGQPQMSHAVAVQGRGEALRIRSSIVHAEFLKGGTLQRLVHSFLYLQLVQITQSILCNRMHEVEQRLARWLLTSADRSESNTLDLTQEFLSQMLGVQRSTVTVAAGQLQRQGLIRYTRGRIHLLDRDGLARTACECYTSVAESYGRLLRHDEKGALRYIQPHDIQPHVIQPHDAAPDYTE